MLCSYCGRESAEISVKNKDGTKMLLCAQCYRRFSADAGARSIPRTEDPVCPKCGLTLKQFRAGSLLGCAECYNAFRPEIMASVRGVQYGDAHRGKHPSSASLETFRKYNEFLQLKRSLEQSIREGDHARTVRLQEELAALKRETFRGSDEEAFVSRQKSGNGVQKNGGAI